MTTVTEIEKIDGELLVRGKLKLVDLNSTNIGFLKEGKIVNPIIISECESFKNGELVWNVMSRRIEVAKNNLPYLFKIIAFPEKFSSNQILDIKDGKLKDGDDVYLVCKNNANVNDAPDYRIKLKEEKYIIFFKKN